LPPDGDFNADHDAVFEQPADSPDLYPEVYVGRLPVSTPAAAHTIISKIKRYEMPVNKAYADKVLFLAEVLFPAPWNPGDTVLQNGADITDYLFQTYVISPLRRVTRCYETENLYPSAVHESRVIAIEFAQRATTRCSMSDTGIASTCTAATTMWPSPTPMRSIIPTSTSICTCSTAPRPRSIRSW
jgi:hypothetical protein